MSGKLMGKILKVNIPEFMQGLTELDAYLDVSGEVLDDVKRDIHALSDMKHYRKTEDGLVDINLHEMGFEIPTNVKLSVKRQVLRDLAQIHMRRGTEDGITHLMRIIGIDTEINRGWLLNPNLAKKGKHRDYFTRNITRVDPNERTYMDFLYGDVLDHADGTFFEGYTYWDIKKEKKTDRIPIYGEVYEHVGSLGEDTVGSTPYLTIRFDSEDIFLVDGEQSVDPNTGEVFQYSVSERFALLEDIIKFFLIGEYRPTTMRIVVESKLIDFDETLYVGEKFRGVVRDTTNRNMADQVSVRDVYTSDGSIPIDDTVTTTIGSGLLVGLPTPTTSRWWGVNLVVGEQTTIPVIEAWDMIDTKLHLDGHTQSIDLPLIGVCDISTVGLDSVDIRGVEEDGTIGSLLTSGRIPQKYKSLQITTTLVTNQVFTIRRFAR